MATITPVPLFMRDCKVQIGADQYEDAVETVVFTPSSSVVVAKAVSPGATYTESEEASWTCDLTFLQDWAAAGSLARYLFDNEGDTVTMLFDPITGGATITASVVISPGSIGGDVGTYGVSTVSLGVVGKPTIGA